MNAGLAEMFRYDHWANQRLLERWTADMIGIERAPGESEAVAPGVTEALHFISTAIEESAQ